MSTNTSKTDDEKPRYAIIGSPSNFWLHSTKTGFDLTHPEKPTSPPVQPRLVLKTSTVPITVSPAKSALVIIDIQNYFLSEALGRKRGAGHVAAEKLIEYAIPAARKVGMQVIWLNWGLTDQEVIDMPPAVTRAFGFEAVTDGDWAGRGGDLFGDKSDGLAVDKFGNLRHLGKGQTKYHKGLGSECGEVTLPSGKKIDAGKLLMRDTWNAALYPSLDACYQEGKKLSHNPDVWIHKNRMSGMWGASTPCLEFLKENGIKTLFFTGVNTDQCVSGTHTDGFSQGYDCVLLGDGAGTTSPDYAQNGIEYNAANTWGFLMTCEDLLKGAEEMQN